MDQAITILDWQRMFFGDEPPLYLLEIVVRTAIVYLYALGLLRWLGSRTIGQLSTVEFLLVIALGSAVGDAMFYPEVPLLHALLVVTIVVLANKGLDILIAKFRTAERAIDGIPEEILHDGVFCKAFFKSTSMGPSEVFQELREHGVEHLGQVARAYVESDGGVAVFLSKKPTPGLPIVPPWEIEKPERFSVPDTVPRAATLACMKCGTTTHASSRTGLSACVHCGHEHFTYAQSEARFDAREVN
jgi:uncharacterized membrane protein YcaP (DUF421 family)